MSGSSQVARALALRCASQLADCIAGSSVWMEQPVVFRAGSLMPSDLYASPSLREAACYVTISAVQAGYDTLPTPLGMEWVESFHFPPVVTVEAHGTVAVVRRTAFRPAPGIVALIWERGDGRRCGARHVVREDETVSAVVKSLAVQLDGAEWNDETLSVPSGTLKAMVGGYGRSSCLMKRQSQIFRLTIWSNSCTFRLSLGELLVSQLLPKDWLAMTDGRQAQVSFEGEEDYDEMQSQILFRRDIRIRVVWDRYESFWSPQMVAGGGWLHPGQQIFPFDIAPDQLRAETPADALNALALSFEMPSAYQAWCVDSDGTVQRRL